MLLRRMFAGSVSVCLALLLNGCGGGGQTSGGGGGTTPTPGAALSVSALTFTGQQGTLSAAQSVLLTNSGTAALLINSILLGGTNPTDFALSTTCGSSVAAGASCMVSITFSPAAAASYAATINFSDNAESSPQTVALSGTGTAPSAPIATLSTHALTFPTTVSGSVSAAQMVTLSNTGTTAMTLSGVTLTGSGAANFTESTTCGASLAIGASCSLSASFAPVVTGADAATINVADNAAGSPQTISLSGTATAPPVGILTLSANSLTFTQAAESISAAQTVTLTNTGTGSLTLTSLALTGSNAASFTETNTCGASLAVNATCVASITFNPYLAMSGYSASLAIVSSSSSTPSTVGLSGTGTGTLSINTSNATGWVISTGAINLTWNSKTGNLVSVQLAGSNDQLVDTTVTSNGQPDGLYMDNTGTGSATPTASYQQVGNQYIDWWITYPSSSTNAFTYSMHYVVSANDPGLHVYYVGSHSATDVAGSLGQIQYVFRINQSLFTNTYSNNSGLNNLGVTQIALPSVSQLASTDPGRAVQNAVEDLHGFTLPSGFGREFMTKYDYSSYEYLHQEHGLYGSTYGAWTVLPSTETLSGGPTKQDLIFTENILMMEAQSSHLDNNLAYTPAQGVASTRLFGPYCFQFNQFNTAHGTPASLYLEAQQYLPFFPMLYDGDTTLLANGYTASTARGTVAPAIAGGGSATPDAAWTVLSDPGVNFQYSSNKFQYWVNNNATGTASLSGVVPGTYRLSHYVLGQWGELRDDGVVVSANQTTSLPSLTFTPENFGTATPIWTIGTPDRSAHEFLHGTNAAGQDDREFWGAWNYWQDFATTAGQQIYYATAVGSTPATNNLNALNYVQWGTFDPGLYGGIYNSADDTTDGYTYVVPSYVGTANVATARPPATTIHFTTTAAQQAQGQYAVLSAGLAAVEGSFIATLNGHVLTWHYINASDAMVRSGLAGYYQWVAFQWPTSDLSAVGADNVLTLSVSQSEGVMLDALRMEITNTSADPAVTGWHDYEYLYGSTYIPANDAVPSN